MKLEQHLKLLKDKYGMPYEEWIDCVPCQRGSFEASYKRIISMNWSFAKKRKSLQSLFDRRGHEIGH